MSRDRLKVLGLCAGNGVCLFPFKKKSFKIIANIEPRQVFYDKLGIQWAKNFGTTPQCKTKIRKLNPDIIIGHPDCGHASVLRLSRAKKNINAASNESLTLFVDGI